MHIAIRLLGVLAVVLAFGFLLSRFAMKAQKLARVLAWTLVLTAAVGTSSLTRFEHAGVRMLAICAVTLWAMKGIVTVEYLRMGGTPLSASRWIAFAAGWPGMHPAVFAQRRAYQSGARALFLRGVVRATLGAALFGLAWASTRTTGSRLLATILLLPSLSLMLHFGLFNMVAALWRAWGIPAAPLFDAPLRSLSLSEFWGRRWNLAFSEMCQLAVYKPLSPWLGRGPATAAAFAFSALLHELAISVPVQTGFGRPLLYFALHGALTVLEKRLRKGGNWPASAAFGRVWSVFWLVMPMPLLFHQAFLREVLWPLVGIA
jgi:hypothetical protein